MLRPPQINISQLIAFFFVGTEGNFTTAAEKFCLTQPAVTKHIRALERQFAVKLIQVRKKRVHLTETGQKLMEYASEIYHSAMKAESLLASAQNTNFRIGVSSALTASLAPILERFRELNPSILLSVKEGASLQIVEELSNFEHDLCVVAPLSKVSDELQVFRIPETEKMVLVTSPGSSWARRRNLTWSDLGGHPFILHREGSIVRQLILEHFRERGIEIRPVANIDSINCMKRLIQEGEGVALMMLSSVKGEVASRRLKIVPITDGDFKMGMDIVMPKRVALSRACRAFLSLLETHFERKLFPPLEEL